MVRTERIGRGIITLKISRLGPPILMVLGGGEDA